MNKIGLHRSTSLGKNYLRSANGSVHVEFGKKRICSELITILIRLVYSISWRAAKSINGSSARQLIVINIKTDVRECEEKVFGDWIVFCSFSLIKLNNVVLLESPNRWLLLWSSGKAKIFWAKNVERQMWCVKILGISNEVCKWRWTITENLMMREAWSWFITVRRNHRFENLVDSMKLTSATIDQSLHLRKIDVTICPDDMTSCL